MLAAAAAAAADDDADADAGRGGRRWVAARAREAVVTAGTGS
ncbi:hypothetical protein GA0070606_4956 [Micromonospora citrea]|uniref:Uncharacterized protein n=1 Tax=Micromonospora citrea TaxID=47855 RepID=A0A1C6VSE5_9ACTN|nr:hypothetical protein GA0070606_4956 [Micromonospora citrea]